MEWREIGPYLRELWHRPAGPMNWKNPIRVFAVAGWLVVQGLVLLGWAGFFSPLWGGPGGALYTVPSRRLTNIRSSFWWNTTPPISSMLWSSGTTLRPSLSSCSPALFPSPFGGFGWKGGGAISHPFPSSRRGRLIPNKRPRLSSSGRSITRSKRGRFSIPHGSPSRSADCIPAWRSSEPWDQAKPRLA